MNMRELYEVYKENIRTLEKRHEQLTQKITVYDKRVALLEEEIDELYAAMTMMRRYLEG